MRQKKSKKLFYLIGLVIIAGLLFITSRESNVEVKKVEQVLENNF